MPGSCLYTPNSLLFVILASSIYVLTRVIGLEVQFVNSHLLVSLFMAMLRVYRFLACIRVSCILSIFDSTLEVFLSCCILKEFA